MEGTQGPETAMATAKGRDKCKRDEWSDGGILSLLEVYEAKWLLRNRAKLKGSDWEDIAREVSVRSSGTSKTPNQCKNKIESMKKRYRTEAAAAAAAKHPSACSSSWQFFARMDSLVKGAPNCSAQPRLNSNLSQGQLQCSHRGGGDDGSNSIPVDLNADKR
ncbi:trihelix transcription factor ASIL1 [Iris pallida]|uniref:Trihelix transcription factor ASIL1 n=1 Tax=Iris pallida TaxID=29817 RepID=A0AAX6HYK7_IRIPA|nr:trihelix transcription factor ASIL1 [Iris pallida]